MLTTSSCPENSQLNNAYRPLAVKSAWSTPRHGTGSAWRRRIECGSTKSRRASRSATTIAYLPSGVKYMLYGSATGIVRPNFPVLGLIVVTLLPSSFSTYKVFRSHDGTTCCGSAPTECVTITRWVVGLMTLTVLESEFGT